MRSDLAKVLFHESTILARLDELADEITREYAGRELTVLAILNGSIMFVADLLRRIPLPLRFGVIQVASYHGGIESSGEAQWDAAQLGQIEGRHMLLLDDILDSGKTLQTIRRALETRNIASLKICVLLSKRRVRNDAVHPDYVAFEIENEFVVGYGLDYREQYRNLPLIGVLRQDCLLPEHRSETPRPRKKTSDIPR